MFNLINSPSDIKSLDINKLDILSKEIRDFLIKSVKTTGGHLASNLGIVEITLAIAKVFDLDKNPVIYDVSHQSYVHKLITGRKSFENLRMFGGISGYTDPYESKYDVFKLGHAGTSISLGMGIKFAADFMNEDIRPIIIIGDASISNGVAFEALNHLGEAKKDVIILLNDNQMSISKTVGALSKYFSDFMTSKLVLNLKDISKKISNVLGNSLKLNAEKIVKRIENAIYPNIFNVLGIKYIGPIDGHSIKNLVEVFDYVKKNRGPYLVHVVTKKGKGLKEAEENPAIYHSVSGIKSKREVTFTDVFSDVMVNIGREYKNVFAITAAMSEGTGLNKFAKLYPDRYIDVGIAEEHAVALAAAMSLKGVKPVVAIYSTFLQRSFDQLFQEISLQDNISPIFVLDRAGLVGPDGPTHHGVFDIGYTKILPKMVLMAPKDGEELEKMLYFAISIDRPVVIRFPKSGFFEFHKSAPLEFGKSEVINYDKNACINIFTYGSIIGNVFQAIESLGINYNLVNLRFAKPLDIDTILNIVSNNKPVITVEEHSLIGGVGESINSILLKNSFNNKVVNLGLDDIYYPHGDRDKLLSLAKLDVDNIILLIKNFLKS
ncbi:MAG TPA: 1-deoxy-D-xylulose-5-phosphate synthase [Spirochaetota bacterium]|nr:1-deoxy-D-xylulose-5-phosphate synthase [Spirochaetota bacterium]HOM37829.1 1-deoxy-D-xylulose-5-phosphate synthase [Spirochaetota bacterium]HPQ49294.1 1-deoxy-D-xylulose-5-phosphate synthase [Spirochaetota bacterium]